MADADVDAIVELTFAVQAVLGRLAAAQDLSLTQLRLLGILRDREPGIIELARYLGLEKSSVSGLVDRAERRGLVARGAAPADGRGVRVSLAPEGKRLAEWVEGQVAVELDAMLTPLKTDERARLASLAAKIV